ncbi:MAG: hypothetical protein KDK36_20390, partial [Leptospiraceae bacterium]|nr:hypothetical protein [Leptospiraceae bacterium]
SFLYLVLCNLSKFGSVPKIDLSILGLFGIEFFTILAPRIKPEKNPMNNKNKLKKKNLNFFEDIFLLDGEYDISRLQIVIFNIIAIGIYIFSVLDLNESEIFSLPSLPGELISLLGVSNLGYLGGKFIKENSIINSLKIVELEKDKKYELVILGEGFNELIIVYVFGIKKSYQLFNNSKILLELNSDELNVLKNMVSSNIKWLEIVIPNSNNIYISNDYEIEDLDKILEPKKVDINLENKNLDKKKPKK